MIIIIPITIIALALIAILTVGRMVITRFPSRLGLQPVGPSDHWVRLEKARREEPVYDLRDANLGHLR